MILLQSPLILVLNRASAWRSGDQPTADEKGYLGSEEWNFLKAADSQQEDV